MAIKELPQKEVSMEELAELLKEGQKYLGQLDETLKDIRVPVRYINPEVLESIKYIFGPEYITGDTSYITYGMFRECMVVLRNVGRATAAEFIGC